MAQRWPTRRVIYANFTGANRNHGGRRVEHTRRPPFFATIDCPSAQELLVTALALFVKKTEKFRYLRALNKVLLTEK
jgi:hypothetical protein